MSNRSATAPSKATQDLFSPEDSIDPEPSSDVAHLDSAKAKKKKEKLDKRMTVVLSKETAAMLEQLSEKQSVSQVEALRRSISTEHFIRSAILEGAKIFLEYPDHRVREVVFR